MPFVQYLIRLVRIPETFLKTHIFHKYCQDSEIFERDKKLVSGNMRRNMKQLNSCFLGNAITLRKHMWHIL